MQLLQHPYRLMLLKTSISFSLVLFSSVSVFSDSVHTVQAVRTLLQPLHIITAHPLLGATGETGNVKNMKDILLSNMLITM